MCCACLCNQQYFLFVRHQTRYYFSLLQRRATGRFGQYFSVLLFQLQPPLDNETQTISINTSKAAFCKKRQTMHSDAYLNVLFLLLLCLPCLVCQCRKFHLVQKCKCCEAQGHPLKENNGHRPAEEQTLPLNHLKRH